MYMEYKTHALDVDSLKWHFSKYYLPAADFTKLYATAWVHLRNVYGVSCAINVAQVDLRSCVKFREIGPWALLVLTQNNCQHTN